MGNFYKNIRNFLLPLRNKIGLAISAFSKKERITFIIFASILFLSALILIEKVNQSFMVNIPAEGGTISEGIVGSPRFINPVLAYSPADNDLVALVYSGLMRKNSEGNLVPDLAEKYEESKDGLSYIFTLKDKIFFQDSKPITADDIIFTVDKVKDPIIKSPKKANWDGVSAEKIDDKTVKFTLKRSYASFLENTTLGILPEHLWKNARIEISDYNINPVGSGPYQVTSVDKQSDGIINNLKMKSFSKFVFGKPYISNIDFNFYANEDDLMSAISNGSIDQVSSITPNNAELLKKRGYTVKSATLPRIFGLFFNQNQNQIFTDKNVVGAINLAIDKEKIVKEVLSGYGVVIDEPIPENVLQYQKLNRVETPSFSENLAKAQDLLSKDGWEKGADGFLVKKTVPTKKTTKNSKLSSALKKGAILSFSISTSNAPELVQTAELIKEDLGTLGIKVDVKTFEIGNLNQSVIRPRKYDALLFGEVVNHESDLFAFWHSSQRNDPGQNIAMYTNAKVDKILEDASTLLDENTRIKKYLEFENEIEKDMPAVFLYSPDFIYVISKDLKGISIDSIVSSSDRFENSYLWYLKTDNVWKIFAK